AMQPAIPPGLEPRTLTPGVGVIEDPLLSWLPFAVLLLPLAGFIVLALFGDWIRDQERDARASGDKTVSRVYGTPGAMLMACATVLGSFALAALSVRRLLNLYTYQGSTQFYQPYLGFEWIDVADFRVPVSLLLDPLSAVMILVVTGIGSLIHIYSLGYMAHDEERVRYFSYLHL